MTTKNIENRNYEIRDNDNDNDDDDDNNNNDDGILKCPNCSTPMQETIRYNIHIDYCPLCKGVWLDRGEVDRLALKIQNRFNEGHNYHRRYNEDRDYDDDYNDDGDDHYYHDRTHEKGKRRRFFGDLFDFD